MAKAQLKTATYKPREAARVANVGVTAIYKGVQQGTIPHIKFGFKILIPKEAFHRWLDSCGASV